MTEASHQIASNPLPPGRRVPGPLGSPTGCEVTIRDDQGALLPVGDTGEVVIRGPNVTRGYENNPAANAARSRTAGVERATRGGSTTRATWC